METGTRATGASLVVESPSLWRARRTDLRHRLICFPHAGGGAGAYADWADGLPAGIEVTAVQLPGRRNRLDEELPTQVAPLVRSMTQALRPLLGGPFSGRLPAVGTAPHQPRAPAGQPHHRAGRRPGQPGFSGKRRGVASVHNARFDTRIRFWCWMIRGWLRRLRRRSN